MDSGNSSGLRPPPTRPGIEGRSLSVVSTRSTSSLSTASNDSQTAAQLAATRMNTGQSGIRTVPSPIMAQQTNFSRPAPRGSVDDSIKTSQRAQGAMGATIGHRPRQHSQGFFEPSLPTASASNMSASAIAAAAAMHHLGPPGMSASDRKRSVPNLAPINVSVSNRRSTSPVLQTSPPTTSIDGFLNSATDESRLTATTAANAAYPKSPGPLSARPEFAPAFQLSSLPERPKEKSKMKLFSSKPKSVAISKDKDLDRRLPTLPSPGKRTLPNLQSLQSSHINSSTTSLADPPSSSNASLYSTANNSTSTLVPHGQSTPTNADKEKDKHRPHFLSRQKKSEKTLMLSSASSNSQAVDPSAPSSLYSFAPQSPGINSTFSKSVTGLDLRHGGKGLRDRRKEEKAASSLAAMGSSLNLKSDYRNDSTAAASHEGASFLGPASGSNANVFSFDANPTASQAAFNNLGTNMGLSGITPDDAWPLLKARLLNIFEGEEIRTPVEDFNLLVSVHIRRCVQKRAPHVLVEDLREFLFTGFASLSQTLRGVPDDKLVPNLVEMWQLLYRMVLPFIQAVFLPLDLEFRGHGTIMTSREAADFWGAMPDQVSDRPSSAGGNPAKLLPGLAEELDVRRMTLISFRDTVIMPRHEALFNTFSRLSLDSINAAPSEAIMSRSRGVSNAATDPRPSTAGGIAPGSLSPRLSSYSSQTSTLLDAAQQSSPSHLRSRATSNTSAGSFGTSLPHIPTPPLLSTPSTAPTPPMTAATLLAQQATHSRTRSAISVPEPTAANILSSPAQPVALASWLSSAQVTATVARMLQCTSILASVQTGDTAQGVMERLTSAIKANWLGGRGRTGRQRKGFVGMRVGGSVSTAGQGSPAIGAMA